MKPIALKRFNRQRRRQRVRRKVAGTAQCPRLAVFRSLQNIYCQLIDDDAGRTLAAASTASKEIREAIKYGGNAKAAAEVGKLIAQKAKAAGVSMVVFDRGPFKFHGRIKALADNAREAGLKF